MSKIVKVSLVILAVLPVLCNLESRAADKQEADTQKKVENPYERAAVTIDASVIEVNLINAAQLGLALATKKAKQCQLRKYRQPSRKVLLRLRRAQSWPRKISRQRKCRVTNKLRLVLQQVIRCTIWVWSSPFSHLFLPMEE